MKAEKVSVGLEMDHIYAVEGTPPIPAEHGVRTAGSQLMQPYRVTVKVRSDREWVAFVDGWLMLTSGRGPRVTRVFVNTVDEAPEWVQKLAEMSEMDTPMDENFGFGVGDDYFSET